MKDTARIKAACLSKTLFVALQTQELVIILDFPPSLEIASGPNFRPNPPIIWDEGQYFWRQTVSAEVNINERLIMAQLRLMASIFCPLFSFDGGSIKTWQSWKMLGILDFSQ